MAEEEKKETLTMGKKVEMIKLLLSSLFARKQKYLLVDGQHQNRLIFTNMEYERLIYYRPTPEDTLSSVSITNAVAPVLYEAFPAFTKMVAEIDLQKFMSAFNKSLSADKEHWPEIVTKSEVWHEKFNVEALYMKVAIKEKGSDLRFEEASIGRLIPDDATEYYENILSGFKKFVQTPISTDVELPSESLKDAVIKMCIPIPEFTGLSFKYPVSDGLSMVSFKEYLKKRHFPFKYNAMVQYRPERQVAKIALGYKDDWVDCLSIMPGTIWFPFKM